MAKDLDGSGITVNVLVPGGMTNTPMISDAAGFNRAELIQPEVMAPPLVWLLSDAARNVTGRRFSCRALGHQAAAGTSGREGWGAGCVDQHRDDAD